VVFLIFGLPFAARLCISKSNMGGTPMLRMFVIIWLLLDFIAVLTQRRLYPYHFLPMACSAALLYGLLPQPAKIASLALGLLPITLLSLTWEGSSISQLRHGFQNTTVSNYIALHTTANDTVFADQIGRLLIETDRQPGSRLGTFFYLVNDDDAPQRYGRTLQGDFESRKPKYLVLANGWDQKIPGLANCDILRHSPQRRENFLTAWATLREYVALRYHPEATIDGFCIYRRNP